MPERSLPFQPLDFRTRLPALDGIRAMAVTLVFLNHFGGGSHGGIVLNIFNHIRAQAWIGVDLFFVLSGFLITGILYDTRFDSHFFKRFFARRSVRIFPVFYLVVVVLLLLTPLFQYQWRWPQLWFLVYLGNIPANHDPSLYEVLSGNHPTAKVYLSHLWSLCVEEQFYLLWPGLVWVIRDRVRLLWLACALCLLCLVSKIIIVTHCSRELSEMLIFRSLPFRVDTLLTGGILALVLRGPSADLWQRSAKWFFLSGGLSALTICALSPALNSPWMLSLGLSAIAIASAGLIGITVRPGSIAFSLFHLRPLRTLGRYSYGFYVYHLLYGWAWIQLLTYLTIDLHSRALAGLIALPANFLVTFLLSKLSYDLYERRFLRWKRRFEYDSEITAHQHAYSLER